MEIEIGKKYIYTSRNAMFEIENISGRMCLVYYPITGAYRKYSFEKILRDCTPFLGKPEKKHLQIFLPRMPKAIVIHPDGVVSYGMDRSTPGAVKILKKLLKLDQGENK